MDRSEIAKHINNARAEVKTEAAANELKRGNDPQQPAVDLSALRQQIGKQFAIPEALWDRLNGGNADEITTDAQNLAEHCRPNLRTVPTPLVEGGGAAEYYPGNGEIDPIKLAARILQRRMGPR